MVKVGNGFYFMFIGIFIALVLTLYFCFRNKSEKFKYNLIAGILFGNLALHFLKLLFNPYRNEFPISLRSITFSNICAVSTIIFPFIYILKGKETLHNYMYFIGFLGGLAALAFPNEAFNKPVYSFDVIRFYLCHYTLIGAPILAAAFGIHKPTTKKIWTIPLYFLAHETLILLNELFIIIVGLVPDVTWSDMLNRNYFRNYSFVFGPTATFDSIAPLLTVFVPKFMTMDIFNLNGGIGFYWPVVWMIIPAIIYLVPVYLLISFPTTLVPLSKELFKKYQTFKNNKSEGK